jgi:FkbM family methyltransferase
MSQQPPPFATVTLVEGVQIVVPDSLQQATPYILREQLDWFEDELPFLRRLLNPRAKVVDIGANYGVYTLSMAKKVGPAGHVWAFEPTSRTASFLAESLLANGFQNVTLARCALSAKNGEGRLRLGADPEFNSLEESSSPATASEAVTVVTLDDRMDAHAWREIEFVKIDAEGEEDNIIEGGRRFFAELSPMVLYEVKVGSALRLELVNHFASIGYESYRLAPGPGLLVPFAADSDPDPFLLNLFCCKSDRAARLAAAGFLVGSTELNSSAERLTEIQERIRGQDSYNWRNILPQTPYGKYFAKGWKRSAESGCDPDLERALSFYLFSHDSRLTAADRYIALGASFDLFKSLCAREPSRLRPASLARVARDFGARALAVDTLAQFSTAMLQRGTVDLSEPFLAPSQYFESVAPDKAPGPWVLGAVLEELERLSSYSSFYSGAATRSRLEMIRDLGFASEEMQRRLSLLERRFGP